MFFTLNLIINFLPDFGPATRSSAMAYFAALGSQDTRFGVTKVRGGSRPFIDKVGSFVLKG
jgi:hypothetical protein